MNTSETERSIDLRILFFRILKKWRVLLLFAAAGLLIGGAFKLIQGNKVTETVTEEIPAVVEPLTEEEFAAALSEYEEKKASLEASVDSARAAADHYASYLGGSVLYHLDPYNTPYANARLVVSATVSDPTAANASNILSNGIRYIVLTLDGRIDAHPLFEKITALTGKEERFLREVISITTQSSSGTLEVTVQYTDLETAEKILDLILDYAKQVSGGIQSEGIASYKVESIKGQIGMIVSTSVNSSISSMTKTMSSLSTALTKAEAALAELEYPASERIVTKAKTSTKKVSVRVNAPISEILKNALLFCAGGLALGLVLIAFRLLLPYKILCVGDTESTYRLPVYTDFGSLTAKHKSRFDKWILRHLEGKTFGLDEDGHASIVRASSEHSLKGADALFLTSTSEDEGPDRIGESLKKAMPNLKIEVLKGVSADPALLEAIPEGAASIVVEKLEKSAASAISAELKNLQSRGASVKGFIVYE